MRNKRGVSSLTRFYNRRTHWFKHQNLVLYLPIVDSERGVFSKPSIYDMQEGQIREVIEADSLEYVEGRWVLKGARVYRSTGIPFEQHDTLPIAMDVSSRDLIDVTGNPRMVGRTELSRLIVRRRQAGFDSALHQVELHQRIAFPLLAWWLFLLAVPWVIEPKWQRSLVVNLGVGVVVVAATLAISHVFRLLALGHQIHVFLGAWGVSLVCVIGIPISWYAQRRLKIRGHLF